MFWYFLKFNPLSAKLSSGLVPRWPKFESDLLFLTWGKNTVKVLF